MPGRNEGKTTMTTYTVTAYTPKFTRRHTVEAEDALAAIRKLTRGARSFVSVTRKNQNAEDLADRDNAHAQVDRAGRTGFAACRKGREEQYRA